MRRAVCGGVGRECGCRHGRERGGTYWRVRMRGAGRLRADSRRSTRTDALRGALADGFTSHHAHTYATQDATEPGCVTQRAQIRGAGRRRTDSRRSTRTHTPHRTPAGQAASQSAHAYATRDASGRISGSRPDSAHRIPSDRCAERLPAATGIELVSGEAQWVAADTVHIDAGFAQAITCIERRVVRRRNAT